MQMILVSGSSFQWDTLQQVLEHPALLQALHWPLETNTTMELQSIMLWELRSYSISVSLCLWDGSVRKGAYCQGWWPQFQSCPYLIQELTTALCPLTSMCAQSLIVFPKQYILEISRYTFYLSNGQVFFLFLCDTNANPKLEQPSGQSWQSWQSLQSTSLLGYAVSLSTNKPN